MPRVVFAKLASVQLVDVRIPTEDGRELLLLLRRSKLESDVRLLLGMLKLELPEQAMTKIYPANEKAM